MDQADFSVGTAVQCRAHGLGLPSVALAPLRLQQSNLPGAYGSGLTKIGIHEPLDLKWPPAQGAPLQALVVSYTGIECPDENI